MGVLGFWTWLESPIHNSMIPWRKLHSLPGCLRQPRLFSRVKLVAMDVHHPRYIYIYLIFDLSQPYGLHGDLTFFTRKYSRTWQKCWGFHLWEIHVASDHAILLWFFQCQICLTWWTQIRELSVTIDLEYWWSMENPPISEAGLLGIGMSLALAFGNVWARVKIGKIR